MGRTNILIVVKTYPEISRKYTETVCTAGVLADSKTFVGKAYATENDIHTGLHDSVESDLRIKETNMPSAEQLRSRLLKKII